MTRTLSPSLCSVLLALTAAGATAQPAPDDRTARVAALTPGIDKLYADLATRQHLPGLVYGIVLDGKLVHVKTLGLADIARQTPVTPTTEFRIASMTKSFVAMAALTLRDEGKLRLDDPVAQWLPELKSLDLPTTDSPVLTLRHLMTMSTGLPEDNPWGDRQMSLANAQLEQFVGQGLSFSNAPGVQYEYSNLGFVLLGKVVSKAAGMRFQDYVTRRILQPLGMMHTRWEYTQAAPGKLALGYRWDHDAWVAEPILHDGDAAAMGGLITTAEDFARYIAFHLNAWPARSEPDTEPVRRATLREMQLPQVFAAYQSKATMSDEKTPNPKTSFYAAGLNWTRDSRNVVTVGHSGGLPGYGSQYRFAPDYGVGVFAFANLRYAPVYAPTSRVLDMLVERAALGPRAVAVSPVLAQRQQQVAQMVQTWAPELTNAIVAENFFLDRSREDWVAAARAQLAPIGRVVSVGPMKAENRLRGTFQLVGEKGALDVTFTLTPEREPKVQHLELKAAAAR